MLIYFFTVKKVKKSLDMEGSQICGVVNWVTHNMLIYQRIGNCDIGTGFTRDGTIIDFVDTADEAVIEELGRNESEVVF